MSAPLCDGKLLVLSCRRRVTVCNNRRAGLAWRPVSAKMHAMTALAATILIVEDDPEISRLIADFMRREGFEVVCAGDGSEMDAALQRLRPEHHHP